MIEHEEIDSRRQQDLERIRRLVTEVGGNVDVWFLTVRPRGAAAEQVSKARPSLPKHSNGLSSRRRYPSVVHAFSLADERSGDPLVRRSSRLSVYPGCMTGAESAACPGGACAAVRCRATKLPSGCLSAFGGSSVLGGRKGVEYGA
jgi:hypothetical protein